MPDIDVGQNLTTNSNKSDLDIFIPRETTEEEMSEIRNQFYLEIGGGKTDTAEIFSVMFDYFKKNNFFEAVVKKFSETFWPLMIEVGWDVLPRLNKKTTVEFVSHTLAHATGKYVDIKDKILHVVALVEDIKEAKEFYDDLKLAVQAVDYPVSFNEFGEKLRMSQVVKNLNTRVPSNDPTNANLLAEVQKALFFGQTTVDVPEIKEGEKRQVLKLFDLLSFFAQNYDVEGLQRYINDYYLGELNDRELAPIDEDSKAIIGANLISDREEGARVLQADAAKHTLGPVDMSEENFAENLSKHKSDFIGWITSATVLRSLLLWLRSFENKSQARIELVKKMQTVLGDESLLNNDLVLALAHLDEFLSKNGYAGEDFFHFDEKSGNFKWGKG